MYMRQRLGEILIAKEHVTAEQLKRALAVQRERGGRIGEVLIALDACTGAAVAEALSEQLDYPYVTEIDVNALDLALLAPLQLGFCRGNLILPLRRDEDAIDVAIADPLNFEVLDEIRLLLRYEAQPVIAPKGMLIEAINAAFERKSRDIGGGFADIDDEESPTVSESDIESGVKDLIDEDGDDEAPVIRFVNSLFIQAIRERASDIHIEPGEKELRVRFRVDGVLKQVATPPRRFLSSIITRVKIMSELDIAEKRKPQDGRIRIKMAGKDVDIRVATAPSAHGERITMRMLDKSAMRLDVRDIGFAPDHLDNLLRLIKRPHGIVLVTGPTGSGKTTTLYSCLSEINRPDLNLLTIEDPVEYQLDGISQMQVNPKIDLTFASGLRSYLRHDPDVIMVGEIRDAETAEMAIKASLTGHLVFSTLHTNDAAGAFTRLTDMGVQPFLVASTVAATLAQRLVRRLCSGCKDAYQPTSEELREIGLTLDDLRYKAPEALIYRPEPGGCELCVGLGYKGRAGIYELLMVSDPLRRLIMNRADSGTIKREACHEGMRTLREDGAMKVLAGLTSIEEVLRVTAEGFEDDEAAAE